MIYKSLRDVEKLLDIPETAVVPDLSLTESLADQSVIEASLGLANGLRDELRLSEAAACVGVLSSGGSWEESGLSRSQISKERRKTLYVLSAANIFSDTPSQTQDPAALYNRYLGQLKDRPQSSEGIAKYLDHLLADYPGHISLFGEPYQPADTSKVAQRVQRGLGKLKPLTQDVELDQEHYHKARRTVRRLSHAAIFAIATDLVPISQQAVTLRGLSKHMGREHFVASVINGGQSVAPNQDLQAAARSLLNKD